MARSRAARWRRHLRRILLVAVCLVGVAALLVGLLWVFTPGVNNLEARVRHQDAAAGTIDSGGVVPARFALALIVTEDSRFYSHHGLDSLGILRGLQALVTGGADRGGATLDQQLAKVLFSGGRSSVGDKLTQVGLALKIDAHYTKAQILEAYANSVYFGNGYTGLTAAARGYFHRTPSQLDWAQASVLAGLVQAPSAYDPITHYRLAKSRQRHVLDRLVATHTLTAPQAATIYTAALGLPDGR